MSVDLSMAGAHSTSAALLSWIACALVLGTFLACLTWFGIRLLRAWVRPGLQVALWAIVLVKFLLPSGPGWSLSLGHIIEQLSARATAELPITGHIEAGPASAVTAPTDESVRTAAVGGEAWHWMTVLAAAYLVGVVVLGMARLGTYRAIRRRSLGLPIADEETTGLVHAVCRRLGVRTPPSVRLANDGGVPFVMGCVRPVLVLPRRLLVRPNELETVVVHEVTHLRRGDMFVRCLQWVAGTVLFFWPVVAWVNRQIDAAREHACDEWALRHGRLTASEYARCLLHAAQTPPARRLAYQPAYMAGNPSNIERRIDMILASPIRRERRSRWTIVTVTMLMAWGVFVLTGAIDTTNQAKAEPPEYKATKEDMKRHADALYARVGEHAAGDVDGNGEVTKEECWAFITAAVLQRPDAVLMEHPQADANGDGELDMVEAYDLVRGDHDLTKVQKKAQHACQEAMKAGDKDEAKRIKKGAFAQEMQTYHVIFDRRARFIDEMTSEPSVEKVKAIADKMAIVDAKRFGKQKKDSLDETMAELASLKQEVAELRAAAAEMSGQKAEHCLQKASNLEEKAAKIRAQCCDGLKKKIAQLEADGKTDKVAELRAKLHKLEDA